MHAKSSKNSEERKKVEQKSGCWAKPAGVAWLGVAWPWGALSHGRAPRHGIAAASRRGTATHHIIVNIAIYFLLRLS